MNPSNIRGLYEVGTSYGVGDIVIWDGMTYAAVAGVQGEEPSAGSGSWLALSVRNETRITLEPPPEPTTALLGATYSVIADFSQGGRFADENSRTVLRVSHGLAVVGRNEQFCTPSSQSWTVWTSPYSGAPQGYERLASSPQGYPNPIAAHESLSLDWHGPYFFLTAPHFYPQVTAMDASAQVEGYGGYRRHGETHTPLYLQASVKNEGWTGAMTENVPTCWHVTRIA